MSFVNVPNGMSYLGCEHSGCSKKVNPSITDHDCCGRCSQGRDHLQDAANSYSGVGTFFHSYFETLMQPGVCATCGETSDAH